MTTPYNTRRLSLSRRVSRGGNNSTHATRSACRQLYYPRAENSRFSPPYFPSNANKVVRCTLGRRKSLGMNLKPSVISMHLNSLDSQMSSSRNANANQTSQISQSNYASKLQTSGNVVDPVKSRIPKQLFGKSSRADPCNKENSGYINSKSCLAVPLISPKNQAFSMTMISEEQDFKVTEACSTNDSLESRDEFLASEAKIMEENMNFEAVVPGSQSDTSNRIQPSVTIVTKDPSDEGTHKKTPTKNNEEDLVKLLLIKLEEYDKLMTDARSKYEEIKMIKKLIEGSDNKENHLHSQGTNFKLRSGFNKSVKKFYNSSVKCNNDIISTFTVPQTPVPVSKGKMSKRKSVGYTPRSLKKVLNQQLEDLCDS